MLMKEVPIAEREPTVVAQRPVPQVSLPQRAGWNERRIVQACWLVVLVLGAIQAWAGRHMMNGDGISYIDIAREIVRGHWANVPNGYWSPLYSFLLAGVWKIFDPTPYWQTAVFHGANMVVLLLGLLGYHYLLTGLLALRRQHDAHHSDGAGVEVSGSVYWLVGYSLFAYFIFNWISLARIGSDLLMCAWMLAAVGALVRVRHQPNMLRHYVWMGLFLGLAYLSKSPAFCIALVMFAAAAVFDWQLRRQIPRVLLAFCVFLLVGSPLMVALSVQKGRLTYSDSGRINYAVYVSGLNPEQHWRGDPPEAGRPLHPTRKLYDDPPIYEFAAPIAGSYPFWFDPSYWYDGVTPVFNAERQWAMLKKTSAAYADMFAFSGIAVVPIILLLILTPKRWRALLGYWWLLLPAFAGLGMHALLHVLPRHVAFFALLLWLVVILSVRIPASSLSRKTVAAAVGLCCALLWCNIISENTWAVMRTCKDARWRMDTAPNPYWEMAAGMQELGLRPGDRVGHIGKALKSWSYWASLADVQIVAELRCREKFWQANEQERQALIEIFRQQTPVRALVTRAEDGETIDLPGWQKAGRSRHYIYFLDEPAPATDRHRGLTLSEPAADAWINFR